MPGVNRDVPGWRWESPQEDTYTMAEALALLQHHDRPAHLVRDDEHPSPRGFIHLWDERTQMYIRTGLNPRALPPGTPANIAHAMIDWLATKLAEDPVQFLGPGFACSKTSS